MSYSKEYLDLKAWYEETADEPCEEMGGFSTAGYRITRST